MNCGIIEITPDKTFTGLWKEILGYRDLFYFFAWRDFKVRYKQTLIGVAWAFLRPMLTMIVFTVVFGKIAELPSDGLPYAVMVFTAMLPWYFFSTTLTDSSHSLVNNATMVSKVYFPRIILPVSTMFVNLVDFFVSFIILALLMLYYGVVPGIKIMLFPLLLLVTALTSVGMGLWFSALNVSYRDFRYVIPFIVQLGLFISPVGFSSSIVPEQWRLLYSLNPMVGVIDGFRWSLLGQDAGMYIPGFVLSVVLSIVLFVSGVWYFEKTEKRFADVI